MADDNGEAQGECRGGPGKRERPVGALIVTGDSRGIGAAAARMAASQGYAVCVNYRQAREAADSVVDAIRAAGGRAIAVQADVAIESDVIRPIYTEMHASGGEPGRVDRVKQFVPLRRGGTAEEVAQAILWLLSPASAFTTGSFIEVAGGR